MCWGRRSGWGNRFIDAPSAVEKNDETNRPGVATAVHPQGGPISCLHSPYTFLNGRPPAEADMIRFFRLTPPTVHQMVLTLDQAGLISRTPGAPRSIVVLLDRSALPELEPRDARAVKRAQ